jgi:membrane dipeptidase
VEVSDEQENRVQRLLDDTLVVSLHDHAHVAPENLNQIQEFRRQGRDWTGYEGLSVSGLDAVFDAFMGGSATITSSAGWKWDDFILDMGMRLSDIAHQDMLVRAGTIAEIEEAKRTGKIAFIPSLEAATVIENEIDRLDVLYGFGVRCAGVIYSESNMLGSGLRERNDGGLSDLGRHAVRRMNKLGMAVDLSHASDQSCLDIIEVSDRPVFITHAGARALWDTKRMKPDNVLRACTERGGIVGISAAANTTITYTRRRHSLESVMEHFEYCANLVGIDNVAFGPDTFFGDHVGMHNAFAKQFSLASARSGLEFEHIDYVDGIENPGESFPNVVRWLVTHEYSDGDIQKVIGDNVMRVLRAVWCH